ncbi:MAG: transmembrane anchor protein [Aliivibrio sp.]|uniref:transmembrane anchor protein n=1 Tax=Aliivibrio sp. TaxID=1872443 RepID=UPI001A504869|nr:transmembrane anchor protein [Aliivibrio sp.]
MYNQNIPALNELPSTKKLIASTFIAAVFSGVILITSILPAEYGIDPTGVGRALGLVEMAEIKSSLAQEQQSVVVIEPAVVIVKPLSEEKVTVESSSVVQEQSVEMMSVNADTKVFILKPGQAAEIKMAMKKGERVNYQWFAKGGKLNFDTHGDTKRISYHGYGKGRNVSSDKGVLEAAFGGSHGWFWRNRSKHDVEVTLTTQGQYENINRVL